MDNVARSARRRAGRAAPVLDDLAVSPSRRRSAFLDESAFWLDDGMAIMDAAAARRARRPGGRSPGRGRRRAVAWRTAIRPGSAPSDVASATAQRSLARVVERRRVGELGASR